MGSRRRGPDDAAELHRLLQLPAVRGRSAGVLRRRSGDPDDRPRRRSGTRLARRPPASCPVHIFGFPAAMEEIEAIASAGRLGMIEDAAQALGAVCADGSPGRRPRQPGGLRLLRQQADDHGGGGDARLRFAGSGGGGPQRAEPGPGAGDEVHGPRAARLQLPADRHPGGARHRPARAPRRDARRPRRPRGPLLGALRRDRRRRARGRRSRRPRPAARRPRTRSAAAGSSTSCACRSPWTAIDVIAELDRRGIDARPYLPCIHLSEFFRERFGTTEGQFPVAEDFSRRSLALPFYPALPEASVERVVAELSEILGRGPA